jgi:hypothetical protein
MTGFFLLYSHSKAYWARPHSYTDGVGPGFVFFSLIVVVGVIILSWWAIRKGQNSYIDKK